MKRLLTLLFVLCLLLWCGAVSALAEGVLRLPASVKDVGEEAFCGDASLDEVVLPEGVETIGARAFAESSLRTVNLPSHRSTAAPSTARRRSQLQRSREAKTPRHLG